MNQLPLFDGRKARAAKARGMARAAAHHNELLEIARDVAESIARSGDGTVTMDEVALQMIRINYNPAELGNAAGSVFKSNQWEFTGERVKSNKVSSHAREIRVWRLK
jgi:hypothetical protein